jgi:acetyltransferase-like isoleucine patch superfamily enzyme
MPGPMRIGRYCSISADTRSVLQNHPLTALTTNPVLYEKAFGAVDHDMEPGSPLVIQDDVWIGNNVVILPGCKFIGRGAVIGAGSIVTKNVDPYTIVVGNPARKLRDRFNPEVIEAIEASGWWNWDLDQLRQAIQQDREALYHPTAATIERLLNSRSHKPPGV